MSHKYLLEIGVEELPSSYIPGAMETLQENLERGFSEQALFFEKIIMYATPRRLVAIIDGLVEKQEDQELEVKGPTKKIAYLEDGTPNKPLIGFMKSQQITEEDIEIREIKGEEYIYGVVKKEGQRTEKILPLIVPDAIKNIYFPKTMRWGGKNIRFARPIRWIVSLLDDQVVDMDVEGIAVSNFTRGHRFLGSSQIKIEHVDEYEEKLKENYVILDQNKRREDILYQIRHLAKNVGGEVKVDENLLEELVYIVEYPTAILGNVKEEYLALPNIVITTPMREHLRFSPVYKTEDRLLPYFITVRNGTKEHADNVSKGNEKVLEARLEDAKFFFEADRKKSLEEQGEKLDTIVFQERLGSMRAKSERVALIATRMGEKLEVSDGTINSLKRAAHLAKADLPTNMVQEFTELEGTMGRIYAGLDGEEEIVAQAIEEQYMPRAAGSELPSSTVGTILSIADKLDTLTGLFAIDEIPTGSQDPFGLRRAVIGIIRMLLERNWKVSLEEMIEISLYTYVNTCNLVFDHEEVLEKILSFIVGRIKNMLSTEGIRYDVLQAVTVKKGDNVLDIFTKTRALDTFMREEDHKSFLEAAERVGKLLASQEVEAGEVEGELLTQEERPLYDSFEKINESARDLLTQRKYYDALVTMEMMNPFIHKYFEDVMVLAEEEKVRNNRLRLLSQIDNLFKEIYDAREIVEIK